MFILGIICVVLVVLAIMLIFVRLVFGLRFSTIQKEPDQSILFRRKVNYVRKIEQDRHIHFLLIICLIFGIALIIFISSFLMLTNDYQKMRTKSTNFGDRLERLEQQQKKIISNIPLRKYPEEGIGLKEYEWSNFDSKRGDIDLRKQIELSISKKTSQYFGSFRVKVSLAIPKTISFQLIGQTDDNISKETIKRNIDQFAKEAEGVSELTNIHVRMVTSVGKEKKVVYSVNYSRINVEQSFSKKNVSEQNIKNDGGKG